MTGSRTWTTHRAALGTVIVAAFALASGVAFAQAGGGGRGPDANRQMDRLTQRLQLDADQQKQIRPILQSRDQQMMALRAKLESGELDRAAVGSRMRVIHQETTQKIEAVLNADQRKEYKRYQAEIAEHMRARHGMQGGGAGMGMGPGSGSGKGMGPGGGTRRPAP